ncbi:hypothetical protein CLV24_13029 [Pontibacter ummariensis]|uniref:Uncharacterized protein n=1 Tax=Pontibacter ummariensis TaxID=1610492 RepID=A0A239KPX0_9BACT|nr:hypothetical protein [Pontibacter ummariensis]PRY05349.1 hypothetical protein CLV24_13029 [Pontibacter ummariensis]SNT19673.1 hypothetical protein SAMN06296052_13029 [Pontibacter ummariensis]
MKTILKFKTDKPKAEVVQATKDYFLSQGFKLESSTPDSLTFRRGSTLQNMFTYNPLKWKSLTDIEIKGPEVNVLCNVTPTSQAVTTKEEKLWENFILNYQQALISNFNYHSINNKLLRETQSDSRKYVKYALIGGVIAGVPAGFIAHYTGIDAIVGIAAAGGGFYYMRHQIEKDKKKKAI